MVRRMTDGATPADLSLILIGGPSGAGKSRLAHALALRTDSTVAQIDDLHTAIETLVPPDRLPEYFVPATTYLRTDSAAEIVRATERIAAFFAPAVLAAVSNRIESGTSTVFEGDFISPEVAVEARSSGVRSLFLLASADDVRSNFLQRERDEQPGRAAVSALRSRRLGERCAELGIPAIDARPFETLLARAAEALGILGASRQ
jgi:2-phosphoglycerate kinase